MTPQEYFSENKARFIDELFEFLRIKSISTETQYRSEVRKAADWVKEKLLKMGMDDVKELLPSDPKYKDGNPVIYGEKIFDEKLPTLMVYGHYDVQPADPVSDWKSVPFEPEIRGDAIFARGSTDNKGQLYSNIMGVEYYLKHAKNKRFNIKFFVEGEEEISSGTTNSVIESHEFDRELTAKYIYISDSSWINNDIPTIGYSLRGLVYFDLHIRTSDIETHSGTYGNAIINPANLASYIVYKLKDIRKNRIRVPGFYKSVRKPSAEEIDQLNKISPSWEQIKKETTSRVVTPYLRKGKDFSYFPITGLRPSFDVHGIESGYTEWGGLKTIIPAWSSVKFSFRLVPYQNPEKISVQIEKYIARLMPKNVEWKLDRIEFAKPYLTDPNNPEFQNLIAAYEAGFGKKPVMVTDGATIEIVPLLNEQYEITALLANYGFSDDQFHGPDEKYNLSQLEGGFKTFVEFVSKKL